MKKFEEKGAKEKPSNRKRKYTFKNMWANRKRKLAYEEQEVSSDDEYLDYDNLKFSFDPEISPKFNF